MTPFSSEIKVKSADGNENPDAIGLTSGRLGEEPPVEYSMWESEQLIFCRHDGSGLRAVIAIDDTTLGPAFGGIRYGSYVTDTKAVREAQRLAAAMTLKNAAAGIPYGGGKSVIIRRAPIVGRGALMRAFAGFVARLHGTYLPGVDMGTTVEDLAEIATVAPDVSCHEDDPSPWTALGVCEAIRAAVAHLDGDGALASKRVLVQGVGHVGASLSELLARDGAHVLVADVDSDRAKAVAREVQADVVDPADVLGVACDVLAPCSAARQINRSNIRDLRCRAIAGAANDTLADRGCAEALAARGIVYVPDFVANAGGVVRVHAQRSGWDHDRTVDEVRGIGDRVAALLGEAQASGGTPLEAAVAMARRRIRQGKEAAA